MNQLNQTQWIGMLSKYHGGFLLNINFVIEQIVDRRPVLVCNEIPLKNKKLSYSNSYIGTILWKQRFNVKHLIKYIHNQKSLYRLVIERLEFEILKRK